MNCKKCNAVLEDGARFCSVCGERVDNKTACKSCGTQYEGKFCPNCGTAADSVPEAATVVESVPEVAAVERVPEVAATVVESAPEAVAAPVADVYAPEAVAAPKGAVLSKVMKITAKSLAFFGSVMAFMLMFFMGLKEVYVDTFGIWGVPVPVSDTYAPNIFYFFGENFEWLMWLLDLESASGAEIATAIFTTFFTFAIAMLTLVLVMVFGIISIVKFAKSFSENAECPIKYSMRTMLAYILGVTLLYSTMFFSSPDEQVTLNSATVAGLVLCTIAIIGTVACKLVEKPARFKVKEFTIGKGVALACAIVSMVVLIIAAHTGAAVKSVWGKENMSAFQMMYDSNPVGVFVLVMAQFMMYTALVFFVISLFRNIGNVMNDRQNSCLAFSIITLVFSSLAILFLYVGTQLHVGVLNAEPYYMSDYYKADLLMPILLFAFALVNLGATITSNILRNKFPVDIDD